MSGLRERQKEKRYQSIINAAITLIGAKGYSATSIEEIAERAEVAVGTVYNYFHTKADIIVELYKRDVAANLQKGHDAIISSKCNYEEMTIKLLAIYAAGYFGEREKALLREIYSIIMSEQAMARKDLLQLDYLLVDQLAGLLAEAQQRNYIKTKINPGEAAYILFSLAMYDFMVFITDDDMKFSELKKNIKKHIKLIFEGLSR
jgi:AcrR family transcriptional regulator